MPSRAPDHKDIVRREYTKQAETYAGAGMVADRQRIARLVGAVGPVAEGRVLEVATGPGYVAMGFAGACRAVVGIDLTAAPLAIAERIRRERRLSNVWFLRGDAEAIPFADGAFDAVVCRWAFHHFEDPPRVLREMARVVRVGGTVAVEDLMVSGHPARAAYHDRFENLRDASHTRGYPLSQLLGLFAESGLEVESVSSERIVQQVEPWLANASTPPTRAAEARALIERDEREDLSGTRPFRHDSELCFTQRTAIIVGRTLGVR